MAGGMAGGFSHKICAGVRGRLRRAILTPATTKSKKQSEKIAQRTNNANKVVAIK
jgi:hypothetical protein